jgi:aryl-alcohol dehydrogenase-like predicted oxidoreductase
MGGIPWSPIAMGFVNRPWKAFSETDRGAAQGQGFLSQALTDADKTINDKVQEIAQGRGVSMATVAFAWTLSKPFISVPILGMNKKERVDGAIYAIDLVLTDEEIKSIDELHVPKPAVSHQ